jgi:hypothetical protein
VTAEQAAAPTAAGRAETRALPIAQAVDGTANYLSSHPRSRTGLGPFVIAAKVRLADIETVAGLSYGYGGPRPANPETYDKKWADPRCTAL